MAYKAVSLLRGEKRAELIRILGDAELRSSDAGLRSGIELVEQSGALAECRADAKALVEAAWPALAEALPQTQAKIMLRIFVTHLFNMPFEM